MHNKGPRERKTPPGDQHERTVCPECDYIDYDNPKIINIAVAVYKDPETGEDMFLFARRGIQPRLGKWTLPGGFMEKGETIQEGAMRETSEEAGADVKIGALILVFTPAEKNEVIMVFRGTMDKPIADPGIESQEVQFFKWKDIPWGELAFPFIREALVAYQETKDKTDFQPKMLVGAPFRKNDASPQPPSIKP